MPSFATSALFPGGFPTAYCIRVTLCGTSKTNFYNKIDGYDKLTTKLLLGCELYWLSARGHTARWQDKTDTGKGTWNTWNTSTAAQRLQNDGRWALWHGLFEAEEFCIRTKESAAEENPECISGHSNWEISHKFCTSRLAIHFAHVGCNRRLFLRCLFISHSSFLAANIKSHLR